MKGLDFVAAGAQAPEAVEVDEEEEEDEEESSEEEEEDSEEGSDEEASDEDDDASEDAEESESESEDEALKAAPPVQPIKAVKEKAQDKVVEVEPVDPNAGSGSVSLTLITQPYMTT